MAAEIERDREKVNWRARLWDLTLPAALCAVAIFFCVQAWLYAGIVHRLGEWQFGGLDIYFPGLTVLALLTLVAVPVLLIVLAVRRRRDRKRARDEAGADVVPTIEERYRKTIATTAAIIKGLTVLATVGAVGMLVLRAHTGCQR